MEEPIFTDKSHQPEPEEVAEVLGRSSAVWDAIKAHLADEYGELTEVWKCYSVKYGWTMKMMKKKRNLFFFIPEKSSFGLAFIFGDKAVAAIEDSNVPENIKEELRNATKYAEGRGMRIEMKYKKQIPLIKKLVAIKFAN